METSQLKNTVLVVFGKDFPTRCVLRWKFDTIVANKMFRKNVEALGCQFVEIETLVDPGSIYEASALAEDLSRLTLLDNTRLSKSFIYKGYELWWIHYHDLFLYFCLPYTQYKRLLEYLKSFHKVSFYRPPYKALFSCYFKGYGNEFDVLYESRLKGSSILPFGVLIQILLTLLSIPILMVRKRRAMLFTGDKFEKSKDYDFRMRFIYEELRQKNVPFVEFIRSLESWKIVLGHAVKRRRPVIYSEAVAFVGRFVSVISGGRCCAEQKFGARTFASQTDPEMRFKLLVATQYLLDVYADIWAIRIMKWILHTIGVNVALIPAATERNFHSVFGCKLNKIPTVGILHGIASRNHVMYDFLPGFNGEKMLSVDYYGVWSEWWKEYYIKYSKAYKPEQLYVSGPMRPLQVSKEPEVSNQQSGLVRVLFISEQTATPSEVMLYLRELLDRRDIELTIKFRPYHDRFEKWLLENEPQILKLQHIRIIKGGMQEAIQSADVTVGCRSTGVLEALLQLKVPLFLCTQKWGDYYGMTESNESQCLFVENPKELIEKIKSASDIPRGLIIDLRERYFGDPYKNGSKWAVDKMEQLLERASR